MLVHNAWSMPSGSDFEAAKSSGVSMSRKLPMGAAKLRAFDKIIRAPASPFVSKSNGQVDRGKIAGGIDWPPSTDAMMS
jgi:hypothetical protein